MEGEDLKPNRFNGECYARVKTKRYDTPMGGRALANMSQGRLILVSELISEGKNAPDVGRTAIFTSYNKHQN